MKRTDKSTMDSSVKLHTCHCIQSRYMLRNLCHGRNGKQSADDFRHSSDKILQTTNLIRVVG